MGRVLLGNVRQPIDELLAFFAPAGYGLGTTSVLLTSKDDLNTVRSNGWYYWNNNDKPVNVPTTPATTYLQAMRVWTTAGGTCYQELVDISGSTYQGCKMQRTIYGTNVFEWEWINPPMMLGYEYRTTERWNGKPVYTKLLDFGASADGASVAHELNPSTIVRYSAVAGSIPLPHFNTVEPEYQITVSVGATNITMACGGSRTGLQTYVQVWYVK